MTEDLIHYSSMIDQAMRGVVRQVLSRVQGAGLPGGHHFYISFLTEYPGVRISESLKAKYPREMTIVLQHQFWDFKVEDQQFTVTLSFAGMPEKLLIPYAALTAFSDPAVKFGLQFQHAETLDSVAVPTSVAPREPLGLPSEKTEDEEEDAGTAEIISLDSFRKK